MLVTALRDGMNLVAKEYVASRFDGNGVLVLSEFAGASDELRRALRINPHDIDGVKDAMVQAIEMPQIEQQRRMRSMRRLVLRNDVDRWSADFLDALRGSKDGSAEGHSADGHSADGHSADGDSADGGQAHEDAIRDLEWTIERIRRH
jgi:trehalose 6-phosphate synthase